MNSQTNTGGNSYDETSVENKETGAGFLLLWDILLDSAPERTGKEPLCQPLWIRVRNKNKLSPMKDRDSLLKNSETKTEKTSRTKKYTKEK